MSWGLAHSHREPLPCPIQDRANLVTLASLCKHSRKGCLAGQMGERRECQAASHSPARALGEADTLQGTGSALGTSQGPRTLESRMVGRGRSRPRHPR